MQKFERVHTRQWILFQVFDKKNVWEKSFEDLNNKHYSARADVLWKLGRHYLRTSYDLVHIVAIASTRFIWDLHALKSPVEVGVLYCFLLTIYIVFFQPVKWDDDELSFSNRHQIVSSSRVFHLWTKRFSTGFKKAMRNPKSWMGYEFKCYFFILMESVTFKKCINSRENKANGCFCLGILVTKKYDYEFV